MMKLLEILENQLRKEPSYIEENGELKKWVILDKARNFDERLVELLLDDEDLRRVFFKGVKGVLIFNLNEFTHFLEQKNFFNDSYTMYKNKVGLNIGGKYIKQRNEVSLVWPYKDCVLEGGQSHEEDKRDEIFFNEILAQDEITQLLEPKVFTNVKRITAAGEMPICEFNRDKNGFIKDNLILRANNLLGLYSIKKEFAGRVKLIYIDPPYNTGSDEFKYNDKFNHSSWLTFMKNRLQVAWELLHPTGAIFIQIDDREMAYLKILCDEIFGRDNFKECISVKNGSESGVNAINVLRGEQLFKVKEHILYYSKNANVHRFKPMYVKAMSFNESYRLEVKKNGDIYSVRDVYKDILQQLYNQETLRGLTKIQKDVFYATFEDYCLENNEFMYALKTDIQKSGDQFKTFAKSNKEKGIVEEYSTSDGRISLVYKGGMLTSLKERIVSDNGEKYYGTLVSDFWWDIGATPSSEGNVSLKAGKKPEYLLKRIIELITEEGDIVCDFNLGSGTTSAVAHKLKRQYIGIEQLEYGENDSVIRLKNVINGDRTGVSKTVNWNGGGEFVYLELKKHNQLFIEQIEEAKDTKNLLRIWESMKQKSFLNYNIDIKRQDEQIEDFKSLNLNEQKQLLCELLDKNQLYVNISSLEDKDFKCTDQEKKITREFYKLK